jgi:hypothetical protein
VTTNGDCVTSKRKLNFDERREVKLDVLCPKILLVNGLPLRGHLHSVHVHQVLDMKRAPLMSQQRQAHRSLRRRLSMGDEGLVQEVMAYSTSRNQQRSRVLGYLYCVPQLP